MKSPYVCWVSIMPSMLGMGFLPQLMSRPGDSSGARQRCIFGCVWTWEIDFGIWHSHQTWRFIYIILHIVFPKAIEEWNPTKSDKLLFHLWVAVNIGALLLLSNPMCLKIWYTTSYGSSIRRKSMMNYIYRIVPTLPSIRPSIRLSIHYIRI